MKRIVIYLTRDDKLTDLDIDATDLPNPNWENDMRKKYSTQSGDSIVLVYDQLAEEELKKQLDKIIATDTKYAIVYHTTMTVSFDDIAKWKFDGLPMNHEEGSHEESGERAKIYNDYLVSVLEEIANQDNTVINEDKFESLWQVFEKKSELELALESLHSDWTSIYFNDESSEDEIKNLVNKRNNELNSLLK